MRVEITRLVPEWHEEIWEVEVPDDTSQEDLEEVAMDVFHSSDRNKLVWEESKGIIESLDTEIVSVQEVSE